MIGRYQRDESMKMCKTLGLSPMTMTDMQFSGGTNAKFLFGFGGALGSPQPLEAQPDIQRFLRHYLDRGVEGNFPSISRSAVHFITNSPRKPIKQGDYLRQEGLINV